MVYNYSFGVPRANRLEYLKAATSTDSVKGLRILDWGGNNGNLLRDGLETGEMFEHDYTCIDVDTDVISECREKHPDANWIIRPVTHPVYNMHQADQDIDFEPHLNKYDIVFAYSVYTHDIWEKMEHDLDVMYAMTRPGGKVCFTFIDPEVAHVFRIKRIREYGESVPEDSFKDIKDWMYFINNDTLTKSYERELDCDYFIAIFNTDWIMKKITKRWAQCQLYKPDLTKIQDWATEAWQPSIVIHKPYD
jgi:SAM-dependent methyltransferase